MKKILTIAAVSVLACVLLAGCGGSELDQDSKSQSSEGNLSTFTAQDIQGKEITQELLAEYDLTMINIWATWCGFCVTEMPELEEVHNEAPENVNVITICVDAADNMDVAQQILQDNGTTFTTLVGNEELGNKLTNYARGFPTTVFVDSNGVLIGKPVSGLPSRGDAISDSYLKIINERLELLEA